MFLTQHSVLITHLLFSDLHRQSAINLNDLSGNVACVVGKQEAGDTRYFICFGETAERDLFENFDAIRFIERAGHVGRNHAQSESVNGDLATGDFFGECFRQSQSCRLWTRNSLIDRACRRCR